MKKTPIVALFLMVLVFSTLVGAALWLQAGLQSPIKTVEATIKTERTTQEETTSKETEEVPLWVIDHYVSKTEWEYARDWGISIPQWIERLGYCSAEKIKERNGEIEKFDRIEIPIYKREFTGVATYYGYETKGEKTATQKKWNPNDIHVASVFLPKSPTLERQTVVDITNIRTGKTVKDVEVEDSGPYGKDSWETITRLTKNQSSFRESLEKTDLLPMALDLTLGLRKKLGCEKKCLVSYKIKHIPSKYNKHS